MDTPSPEPADVPDRPDSEAVGQSESLSEPERSRPPKWLLTITIGVVLVIQIGNYIAAATIFTLLAKHPVWLILLQPTTKNLLLVIGAANISAAVFFSVTILRRQVPHVPWFFIGRWYGNTGIRWVKKRSFEMGSLIEQLEEWFPRFGPLICALYPHPIVCAMAGASKMRFVPFLAYTFGGIIFYTTMAWYFGDALKPITQPITHFGTKNMIPLTILTAALVAFSFWKAQRSDDHKIESIGELERDLEQGDDKPDVPKN